MDFNVGVLCGLTQAKPAWEEKCNDFNYDEPEANRLANLQKAADSEEEYQGSFGLEKKGMSKGVLGGIIMMAIALVWFVGGWIMGIIFFYPPILFVIGLVAFIKGAVTGNIAGKST
jgi:hypothetical protein